jgi:exosortase
MVHALEAQRRRMETELTVRPSAVSTTTFSVWTQWRAWLLAALVALLFAPTLRILMLQWWDDPNYSHGLVLPFLCAFILWQKREEVAALPNAPSVWGWGVVLVSLCLLFLGSLGAELFLTRMAFWGTVVGILLYFFGWARLRAMAFPLGLFLLAIPLPTLIYNQIVFPLQLVASRFATVCLEKVDVMPVLREGNLLILPGYTLEVVEACSGIRSLMSLIALAVAYGYFLERRTWMRWLLVLAVLPLAIFSNGVRVFVTAMLTHFWGLEAAEGFLHSFSGWMIFVVSMVLLLLLHTLLLLIFGKGEKEAQA